jgi:predicted CoA-substrate-specific enzyme activase
MLIKEAEMICAGIDIGSRTTKAVILKKEGIQGYSLIRTSPNTETVAKEALELALIDAGFEKNHPADCIVATGYGRIMVPFARKQMSEIACHAKGAGFHFPSVRTIIDMGGQDCKGISVDDQGHVSNFVMNDKCAAGTGRFIELIAEAFEVPLEQIGDISLSADKSAKISSICSVFARSEALVLAREGVPKDRIIAGIHVALTQRTLGLVRRIDLLPDLVITGGIAKNKGFVKRIESELHMTALIPQEPQVTGALGAAVFAMEEMKSNGTA